MKKEDIKKLNKVVNKSIEEFIPILKQTIQDNNKNINKFATDNGLNRDVVCKVLNKPHKRRSFKTMHKIIRAAGIHLQVKCVRTELGMWERKGFGTMYCCPKHKKQVLK